MAYVSKPELEKQLNDVIGIALWSIRRLPKSLKKYALRDLKTVVGDEHELSDFINKCISELPTD